MYRQNVNELWGIDPQCGRKEAQDMKEELQKHFGKTLNGLIHCHVEEITDRNEYNFSTFSNTCTVDIVYPERTEVSQNQFIYKRVKPSVFCLH